MNFFFITPFYIWYWAGNKIAYFTGYNSETSDIPALIPEAVSLFCRFLQIDSSKGQLIAECLFPFPKKEQFDKIPPQNLKSGLINKMNALIILCIK